MSLRHSTGRPAGPTWTMSLLSTGPSAVQTTVNAVGASAPTPGPVATDGLLRVGSAGHDAQAPATRPSATTIAATDTTVASASDGGERQCEPGRQHPAADHVLAVRQTVPRGGRS